MNGKMRYINERAIIYLEITGHSLNGHNSDIDQQIVPEKIRKATTVCY